MDYLARRRSWVIYILSDPQTPEAIRYVGVTHGNLGKKQDPKLVEKRVAPLRGRPLTEEAKANIRAGMKGWKMSPEGHAAIAKARLANPNWNASIARSNKGTWERRGA